MEFITRSQKRKITGAEHCDLSGNRVNRDFRGNHTQQTGSGIGRAGTDHDPFADFRPVDLPFGGQDFPIPVLFAGIVIGRQMPPRIEQLDPIRQNDCRGVDERGTCAQFKQERKSRGKFLHGRRSPDTLRHTGGKVA